MTIFDLFSKRKKRLKSDVPDVFHYEDIPNALRVQVVHIWKDAFGDHKAHQQAMSVYKFMHDVLCREYGLFTLQEYANSSFEAVVKFFLQTDSVEKVIDVIELSFRYIDRIVREDGYLFKGTRISPDDAISELNTRFREHSIGYQYESGQMIRVDSQLIHNEIVQPALRFLSSKSYRGANEEFLSAHAHYRSGKYKECLADCLKAFESTMKAICDKQKWSYSPRDTAKQLIAVILNQGLVPAFMQTHFAGMRSTLEAGIPTIRNKLGGHGQGSVPTSVPESIASYALHLTATTIVFLSKAEIELK